MARRRVSMREGPLAELFKATEAAQRQAERREDAPAEGEQQRIEDMPTVEYRMSQFEAEENQAGAPAKGAPESAPGAPEIVEAPPAPPVAASSAPVLAGASQDVGTQAQAAL